MIVRVGSLADILPFEGEIKASEINKNPHKHSSLPDNKKYLSMRMCEFELWNSHPSNVLAL